MIRRARPLLGTLVEIAVDAHDETSALRAIGAAFAEIGAVHGCMSFHAPDSDLARIHRAPVGQAVDVDARTMEVLRCALRVAEISRGAFDPACAAHAVACASLPRPVSAYTPDRGASWRDVELVDDVQVRLRRSLWLDLGGIAKGYAVDRACAVLRDHGIVQSCVNAGGDLRVAGARAERIALRILPQSAPRIIELADGAVASSAATSILRADGTTPQSVIGASVVAPDCMSADALTKVVLAAPARIARACLALFDAQALIQRSDGAEVWERAA